MTPLLTLALAYLERRAGWKIHRQETVSLLGRTYRVVRGTVRERADYDDAWLLALAQHASVVFDVGSNIGQSALLLLSAENVKQIVLIEPNPSALSQAAENLIFNGLSEKARFVCAFASSQAALDVDFYTIGAGAAGSMHASHAKTASTANLKKSVPTTTVDHLVKAFNYLPDLVKIDTEGAERLVLQGATALAQKKQTRFFVEMHSSSELSMRENARHVLDWCVHVSYQAWYLKTKLKIVTPEQIANRGRCHLLLLPEDQDLPEGLVGLEQGAPLEKDQLGKKLDPASAARRKLFQVLLLGADQHAVSG